MWSTSVSNAPCNQTSERYVFVAATYEGKGKCRIMCKLLAEQLNDGAIY